MKEARKQNAMRRWLAEKARRSAVLLGLSSAGLLVLGAVGVYITFWIFYGVLRFGGLWIGVRGLLFAPNTVLMISGILIGLLFVGQLTAFRRAIEHYEFETGASQFVSLTLASATGYSFLSLAAGPKTALSFVKLLAALVSIGPALMIEACRQAFRAIRLSRIDVESCAPILATLYDADAKVPFEELFRKHPSPDPEGILRQLQALDGVLFRTSDPPGLSLAAHLREELEFSRRKES